MRIARGACYTILRIEPQGFRGAMTTPLTVHVNASERRVVEDRAERAGLSVSAYLRAAALGRAVRTRGMSDATDALCDLEAVLSVLARSIHEAADAAGCTDRVVPVLGELDAARVRLVDAAGRL